MTNSSKTLSHQSHFEGNTNDFGASLSIKGSCWPRRSTYLGVSPETRTFNVTGSDAALSLPTCTSTKNVAVSS
jgi:hypothetical protein